MTTPPSYIPTPHLIACSRLSANVLVSQFQDFRNTIQYISTAPELVFERLVANLSDCFTASLGAEREAHHSDLQTNHEANGKLTGELAKLKDIDQGADISKVVAVKAVAQKINPTIATFHTSEVRSSKEVRETSKVVFLTPAYTMVPGLVIGLTALDIGGDTIVRATAFASMIQRDRFEIHLDSWHDTKLYGAGCSWLQLEADDKDFQYGSYNTIEDHPSSVEQMYNTRRIMFKRPYASPPQVVVWLTAFALGSGSSWRITSFATDVTEVGFTIHIGTWEDSRLYRGVASWIAYPPDRQGVASGNFSTLDLHSWAQPQSYNSAYVAFGNTIFKKPPRTFVALNSLDISCGHGMRLAVKVDNVSTAGMSWHLDSWSDTILNSAGASYLAFS